MFKVVSKSRTEEKEKKKLIHDDANAFVYLLVLVSPCPPSEFEFRHAL